jgi:hypothetical protein
MVKDIERFNKEGMLMNEVLSYFKDYEGGLEPPDLKNYSKKSIYALAKLAVMELYK